MIQLLLHIYFIIVFLFNIYIEYAYFILYIIMLW